MLDVAIKNIVALNGPYWPAALDSIKCTFEYDSHSLSPEASTALKSWLELLSPDNADLSDRLRILVINPPWEHRKDANDHYVDVAGEKAEALAVKVSVDIDELFPHLPLLLHGEQKQAYVFGNRLALELKDVKPLLDSAFEKVIILKHPNLSFLLGIFHGLFSKSPTLWEENLNQLLVDDRLTSFYPDFMRTGEIQKSHLDILMNLILGNVVDPSAANGLSYGSVTDNLEPEVIAEFCLQLSKLGEQASWVALNVMYMYCFSNKAGVKELREPIKQLILEVPLHKGQHHSAIDVHHWRDLTEKLMIVRDEEFAVSLVNQLIATTKIGLNHGDIWSYTKPLLMKLMENYCDAIWPTFGNAIVMAEGMERYWLQQLLDRENGAASNLPSVFSVMPVEIIIDWCTQQPEIGPVFVASCLNLFETIEETQRPTALLISLLERFGDDPRVMRTLSANTASRGWSGSLVPYLEADKTALSVLLDHKNINVRGWVKAHIASIDRQIKSETISDDERNIGFH